MRVVRWVILGWLLASLFGLVSVLGRAVGLWRG